MHYQSQAVAHPQSCYVLSEYQHLLPDHGYALDLACGMGGNAVLLAKRGLQVTAWDFSEAAIKGLSAYASSNELKILAEVRDVEDSPPEIETFDVIVVSYFLERDLAPFLMQALRPGGLLFYQTFIRDVVSDGGPRNPQYRLARGELLDLFADLHPLIYREEGSQGDVSQGLRNEALLVAQR
ncbi:MAG: class I SAM-dependent methyltransferase [Gammaproteobacteria bacterium]|nr:class I SAM-dependent methyltransferase [Gammaproteobacteria bacterium]